MQSNDTMNSAATRDQDNTSDIGGGGPTSNLLMDNTDMSLNQASSFYEQRDFASERALSSASLRMPRAQRGGIKIVEIEDVDEQSYYNNQGPNIFMLERPETSAMDIDQETIDGSKRITLSKRPPAKSKRDKSKSITRRGAETAARISINRDYSMYDNRLPTSESTVPQRKPPLAGQ